MPHKNKSLVDFIKLHRENDSKTSRGSRRSSLRLPGRISYTTHKCVIYKEKIYKFDYIRIKNFCSLKAIMLRRMKNRSHQMETLQHL